jgi:hypothetical protein
MAAVQTGALAPGPDHQQQQTSHENIKLIAVTKICSIFEKNEITVRLYGKRRDKFIFTLDRQLSNRSN